MDSNQEKKPELTQLQKEKNFLKKFIKYYFIVFLILYVFVFVGFTFNLGFLQGLGILVMFASFGILAMFSVTYLIRTIIMLVSWEIESFLFCLMVFIISLIVSGGICFGNISLLDFLDNTGRW